MRFITPKFIQEWRTLIKEKGFKTFLKEKGWKFVLVFILFYLVRDTLIYIIIPLVLFQNVTMCQ